MKHTKSDLKQMQSLPLSAKIIMTQRRIRDWYDYWDGQVYVSFSGGKDSTVLLHLVRDIYPDVEAVFVNTGLEYPEIQKFVKTFENVTILRSKMRFDDVIKTYGYPMISKEVSQRVHEWHSSTNREYITRRWLDLNSDGSKKAAQYSIKKWAPVRDCDFRISHMCCNVMKKQPAKQYEKQTKKHPFFGTMACESALRANAWTKNGCNAFDSKRPVSNPLSFWTEQDVLQYIKQYKIPIASVYGSVEYETEPEQYRMEDYGIDGGGTERLTTTGCYRTGCIFCGFGCHLDKEPSRFQRLKETHPRQYAYCMGGGEYGEDGIWRPSKNGLGMRHVFDELNRIYGEDFIKYE